MWGLATALALRFVILTAVVTAVLTWRDADLEAAYSYACFSEDTQASAPMPTLTAI